MSKQNKILIIVGGIVLIIVLIVMFLPNNKSVKINEIKKLDVPVVIIPTQDKRPVKSDTGAIYISPSDGEYREIEMIKNLRKNCPVRNDFFEIDYDYNVNKFTVLIKRDNINTFLQWKNDSGYNYINDKYWQLTIND